MISHCKNYVLPAVLAAVFVAAAAQADTWSSLPSSTSGVTKVPPEAARVPSPSTGHANQLLFSEIELLKQEVQGLQGRLEEQEYELNKLKNEQKERYLDLDRRIGQLLSSGGNNLAPQVGGTQGKSDYDAAFQLMKSRKLDEAVVAFTLFLQNFPKSSLVVNGYYWLGQIYYKQTNLDEARKAFTFVKNQFPNHAKTPDSKYKLGIILHRLGDDVQARDILREVVRQHAESASARFAEKYLKENFSPSS